MGSRELSATWAGMLGATRDRTLPRFDAGQYVTDGTRLFYVTAWVTSGPMVGGLEMEDCATLDARPYSWVEVEGMDLRAVR